MNVLDLFSGIGGFSLGLERAGMRTVAFCEIAPHCRRVLARHWPDVPVYDDVRTLTAASLADAGIGRRRGAEGGQGQQPGRTKTIGAGIDVICGGFPCQDISVAGKGAGITGERSGLWKEYARIIGEVRPRYVIVENVAALLHRGLGDVLGDLSTLGYDAEWHCIRASDVGAPHRRDRIWIIAYPDSRGQRERGKRDSNAAQSRQQASQRDDTGRLHSHVADAGRGRQPGPWQPVDAFHPAPGFIGKAIKLGNGGGSHQWSVEPDVGRVAHGVPARVDRLRSLGNAVVPQIPEIIGRAIMQAQTP